MAGLLRKPAKQSMVEEVVYRREINEIGGGEKSEFY